ncbi:hypothetical protein M8J76_009901 [Diaphorina citri]|nr:hypothetical protein M8J75_008334 [Diaphorina citri]KAI5730092.1 hypothetical protein M8J76_009901 [Diaphorina citri]KAI5734708.1 hypothetical protein M8J77_009719 [Diaphorina citri]
MEKELGENEGEKKEGIRQMEKALWKEEAEKEDVERGLVENEGEKEGKKKQKGKKKEEEEGKYCITRNIVMWRRSYFFV